MEYTIKKIAELSGISTRTLRYYDEINLLKPTRINSSGYRIYGIKEVDRLQQILFYRSLDIKLEDIQTILSQSEVDIQHSLKEHYNQLLLKRQQIDSLLLTVEKTIRYQKGEITMNDQEKFEGLKREALQKNEKLYGKEIREKYGESTVETSNKKWLNLSKEQFNQMEQTEQNLFSALKKVIQSKDYDSPEAKEAFESHKEWLLFTTPHYSVQMHRGLGEMYIADERFASYYNSRVGDEASDVLNKIIQKYAIQ
ncbi:MerR family transcriptional regulator [Enterococcus rivorum]|uniref:MerR family transcriptional regulator n=1 Tax=Enterococcus rivorum TaxID=762845 RepID=A0A1E5KTT0_9ENTE|nr:MerR family transcriptional regulator [Enterococcus rivorum]MBP2097876.1 DNA-binding transcriptional MerR regulator [Enterococcus rivorum]OEH81270.1 MerR family transcriptional regulator [Enterococcus rivorum]